MAKDLPWFKFNVSEWILGRIYDYPDKVQGAFLIALCHYWNKNCEYNANDFERKIGKKRFSLLLELKFIEVENENVYIDFLDEQHSERTEIQKVKVKGGLARAKQVQQQKVSYIDIEEKRVDIEEKRVEIKIVKTIEQRKIEFSDSLNPFLEIYTKELGLNQAKTMLNKFYLYWTETNEGGKKFRRERESTWDLARRLNTWVANDKNFNKTKNNENGHTSSIIGSKKSFGSL